MESTAEGDATYSDQWYVWETNASGVITKGSGWKSTDQALEAGWETTFGDVIKIDGINGLPVSDANGDGFVDNWSTYRLTDGSNAVQISSKKDTLL